MAPPVVKKKNGMEAPFKEVKKKSAEHWGDELSGRGIPAPESREKEI